MRNEEKKIWHHKDIEYFHDFPAPIMENTHRLHFTNINATIPFFGPMLYFLVRAFRAEKVLEIGCAEGYSAFYISNAIKDNMMRYGLQKAMYYGIDIVNKEVHEELIERDLPNKILYMDSKDLSSKTFEGITFDLIFQDGDHSTRAVIREFELLWSQLKGNGKGYWIFHDSQGPAEEGWKVIRKMIDSKKYNAEYVTLDDSIYGMTIIRKMDGFDYNEKKWKD